MGKSKVYVAVVGILAVALGLRGCGSSSTSGEALAFADNLKESVSKFEDTRSETAQAIGEKTEAVVSELRSQPTPNLKKAADDWESGWSDVNDRITKLTTDFDAVRVSSEKYFEELEKQADQIKNPTLKGAELEKNRVLRATWNSEYAAATEHIGKLRNVAADGADFQHILISAGMRDRIQHNIENLRELSAQANGLLGELAKLSAQGRHLVETNNQ